MARAQLCRRAMEPPSGIHTIRPATDPLPASAGSSRLDVAEEAEVERRCDAYLAQIAEGRNPDVEALATGLPEGRVRSEFLVRVTAGELIWRRDSGQDLDLTSLLQRLPAARDRTRVAERLGDALQATQRLPATLTPSTLVAGRYRIIELLGRGGVGTVYSARDQTLERIVALKIVGLKPGGGSQAMAESVIEESKTLAGLSSENIVAVHDLIRGQNRLGLVLDLIPGIDLHAAIEEIGRVPWRLRKDPAQKLTLLRMAVCSRCHDCHQEREGSCAVWGADQNKRTSSPGPGIFAQRDWYKVIAQLGRDLARAMDRAHEAGVLHRDLKPQNVMLSIFGVPVVLDFGLAYRFEKTIGDPRRFQGTPEYLAPEQAASHETGHDPRTDVYGLGLILYELLTLGRGFIRGEDETLGELLGRIQRQSRPGMRRRDPGIPGRLVEICEHALEVDPDRRYAGMDLLADDLSDFLEDRPAGHTRRRRRRLLRRWDWLLSRRKGG